MRIPQLLEEIYLEHAGTEYEIHADGNQSSEMVIACKRVVERILDCSDQCKGQVGRDVQSCANMEQFMGAGLDKFIAKALEPILKEPTWSSQIDGLALKGILKVLPVGIESVVNQTLNAIVSHDFKHDCLPSAEQVAGWKERITEDQLAIASFPQVLAMPVRNQIKQCMAVFDFDEGGLPCIKADQVGVFKEVTGEQVAELFDANERHADFLGRCPAHAWLEDFISLVFDICLQHYKHFRKRLPKNKSLNRDALAFHFETQIFSALWHQVRLKERTKKGQKRLRSHHATMLRQLDMLMASRGGRLSLEESSQLGGAFDGLESVSANKVREFRFIDEVRVEEEAELREATTREERRELIVRYFEIMFAMAPKSKKHVQSPN